MKNKIIKLFSLILIFIIGICPVLVGCGEIPENSNISEKVETSFGGRSAYKFKGVNDKDVTVETFFISPNEQYVNNPNIGQAVMLNDAIRYKTEHPEKEVYATITSFHYSVVASVCLDETSNDYLKMKSLYDVDFDDKGYVRIAYLPIKAAMQGVNVIVIGQIDASPVIIDAEGNYKNDYSFEEYYNSYLDNDANIEGKKVSDYLNFKVAKWTSYGDKSATDMMHLKSCSVSNYRDYNGVDHGKALWLGSVNVDGIDYRGVNGNNNTQTATIISEHDKLYNVLYNYTKLMSEYCEQEDINEFRHLINLKNKEQIDLILAGNGDEINANEQIVYLGTEKDSVFELYFTPLAGSVNEWSTTYNPYAKYISKLLPENTGNNEITFSWATAKYVDDSTFSKILINTLIKAFNENKNINNRLFLSLPYWADGEDDNGASKRVDYSVFDGLVVGKDIGFKKFGVSYGVHSKDFQLSYVENGERQYVSVLNTLNFHQGSSSYQTNSFLIIKENANVGNNIYVDFGKCMSEGAITEADRIR